MYAGSPCSVLFPLGFFPRQQKTEKYSWSSQCSCSDLPIGTRELGTAFLWHLRIIQGREWWHLRGGGGVPCKGGFFCDSGGVRVGVLSAELLSWMERAASCWEVMTQSFSSPGSPAANIHTWEASP